MYRVYLTNYFLKKLKPYLKKFRNLETDIIKTLENFLPETSDRLGHKLYKVRLKSSNLSKGKNKSFRMIIFLLEIQNLIVPIIVYFKGDQADISPKEIEHHLEMTLVEIKTL